ncbi:MAG: Fe2+-dependent dioxygenase [Rhodospirillaceae bacterium]|nr:MAG: Fe2+-dependent dioxygenase [Rhodospirillaceae bacterium]
MLLSVPDVLTAAQVNECRQALESAAWVDGRATAGYQAAPVKDNMQLAEGDPIAKSLGAVIVKALEQSPRFISAALPLKVVPPVFNRYSGGQTYGGHIDGAIRSVAGTAHRVRTDLSATLFLSAPEDYDGGELVLEDSYGTHTIKLPAGHMVLYPSSSVHHVSAVTRGARLASIIWIQSMVREDHQRAMLYNLDTSIQELRAIQSPAILRLMGVYHNLLRHWAET